MDDMIGGFFGLELPRYDNFPYRESACCAFVNSGRTALACLLDNMPQPRRIYLPVFACDTLSEPCRDTGIPLLTYGCHTDLSPILPTDATEDDLIILINYFGLTGSRAESAARQFPGQSIIDATTALYAPPPSGTAVFYSPRKFAGVADGGVALAPFPLLRRPEKQDIGALRSVSLLQRCESGAIAALDAAEQAEAELHATRRTMSPLTRRLLQGIDFISAAHRRCENYRLLHRALAPLNRLSLPDSPPSPPMCYPLVSGIPGLRDDLIDAGIALPLFWPEVIQNTPAHAEENKLARSLLPLPLDQRYGAEDMLRMIHLIIGHM